MKMYFLNTDNPIQYLSTETLNKIFAFVGEEDICNSIPLVCKKWKIASLSTSTMLQNATFSGKCVSCDDICNTLRSAPRLKCVLLLSVNDVVPVLRQLCRCNKEVVKLTLKSCSSQGNPLPENVLMNALASLPNLQSFELNKTQFKSSIFYEMLACHPKLTGIDISLNKYVTLLDLMKLVYNSKVEEFKMSRRHKDFVISDFEVSHLIRTMKHRLTVLHLDMRGLNSYTFNEILCCYKLTDVKLNSSMNLTREFLTKLCKSLKNLQHLCIEGPSMLSKGDIQNTLFQNNIFGVQLRSLKLKRINCIDNNECCEIMKTCGNLEVLSLKSCKSLTIKGIETELSKLANLKSLNVAFIGESVGLRNIVTEHNTLETLIIDESSWEINNHLPLSTTHPHVKIIKLQNKNTYY